MKKLQIALSGKKTYIIAACGIIGSIGLWLQGDLSGTEFLQTCGGVLMAMTLRAGIAKGAEPVAEPAE